ncbi:hypothetical protein RDI58_007437 [Solanum bulbocastanum]|uniref:Uncharacterized protein n=1 Tax=Solanum bulbocastanum TaxID=147425 RepID=A0AAN8TWF5_SOLBU
MKNVYEIIQVKKLREKGKMYPQTIVNGMQRTFIIILGNWSPYVQKLKHIYTLYTNGHTCVIILSTDPTFTKYRIEK